MSPSPSRNGGVAETIHLITHQSPPEWSNICVTAASRCAAYRRHTGQPGCRPCPAAVTTAGFQFTSRSPIERDVWIRGWRFGGSCFWAC